jgi:hypothetical protein
MPNFGSIPPEATQQEATYRRGYLNGVQATIRALDNRLIPDDQERLARWTKALREWQSDPDRRAFAPSLD